MTVEVDICRAQPSDSSLLAELRVRSSAERHTYGGPELVAFLRASEMAFAKALTDGSLRAWLAFDGKRAIGTASLMFLPSLPRFGVDVLRDGRIRNVYVDPDYRRRGIALAMMRLAMAEAFAAKVDRLTLGTSPQGRPLYEFLGFVQKEDELIYKSDSAVTSSTGPAGRA
jgi:ribosomal protein S18 acetylase RimI-like enzyme